MAQNNEFINARLNDLLADYRKQMPETLQVIAALLTTIRHTPADMSSLQALYLALHKLAGSGASFGYSEMGKVARQWENMTHLLIETKTPPSLQKCDEMHCFLKNLLQASTVPDEN